MNKEKLLNLLKRKDHLTNALEQIDDKESEMKNEPVLKKYIVFALNKYHDAQDSVLKKYKTMRTYYQVPYRGHYDYYELKHNNTNVDFIVTFHNEEEVTTDIVVPFDKEKLDSYVNSFRKSYDAKIKEEERIKKEKQKEEKLKEFNKLKRELDL